MFVRKEILGDFVFATVGDELEVESLALFDPRLSVSLASVDGGRGGRLVGVILEILEFGLETDLERSD